MLTDEEIIECWNEVSFEHAATKNAFGRAVEAAVIEKLKTAEPVYYEYRSWYGPQTVINGWGDWERVNPRNALCTIADAVNELEHYISAGYKYELRALYPAPLLEDQIAEIKRKERERCAAVCGQYSAVQKMHYPDDPSSWVSAEDCAEAIRSLED